MTNMKQQQIKAKTAANMPIATRSATKATVFATALSVINARPSARQMNNALMTTIIIISAAPMAVVRQIHLLQCGIFQVIIKRLPLRQASPPNATLQSTGEMRRQTLAMTAKTSNIHTPSQVPRLSKSKAHLMALAGKRKQKIKNMLP